MSFTGVNDVITATAVAPDTPVSSTGLSGQTAGGVCSYWRTVGLRQGAVPGAAAVCDATTIGAMALPSVTGGQKRAVVWAGLAATLAGTLYLMDRLAHMGGLSGIVTTAQTANVDVSGTGSNMALRRGASDYSNIRWFLEWYVQTGATGVNATVSVTYSDNSTGNIVVVVPANTALHRAIDIVPTNGLYIKSVQSVTLSATTGTAGSFGVTAVRELTSVMVEIANRVQVADWAALSLPIIEDNACVMLFALLTSTTLPNLVGRLRIGVA
jgi:hypothetical protein